MQKINYPLIVSDFDGTLLRSDHTIAEETKRTIENYVAAGGHFAICTGRMTTGIINQAKSLGLKGLLASYQGSVVSDIESGEILVDGFIPLPAAQRICRLLEGMNLHFHVYDIEDYYSNRQDKLLEDYERILMVKAIIEDQKPLSELIVEKQMKVRKILCLVEPENKLSVYQKLQAALGEEFYVTYSAVSLVEITSKEYSKATAVRFLADRYGVPYEKTVAIGDSLNDQPMIGAAGVGLAVGNADEYLKELAEVFPATNDENAVGKIIEKYGYYGDTDE